MAVNYKDKLDQVYMAIGGYFAVLKQLRENELFKADTFLKGEQQQEYFKALAIAQGLEIALDYADELLPTGEDD